MASVSASAPHFARLSGLGPLPRLFEERAGSGALRRLLAEADLRLEGLHPATPVPFANLNQAFNRASRLSGDPLFSLQVAQAMSPEDYGPFVLFALQGPTLRDAIRRVVRLAPLQNTTNRFILTDDGRIASWTLAYAGVQGMRIEHHALHVLVPMIRILRRYAGEDARPFELRLAVAADPARRALEQALAIPIRTGADTFTIVFPSAWLRLARPAVSQALTLAGILAYYRREALPRSMSDAVAALIAATVGEAESDLDAIAARLGVSRRTLQQRLNAEGARFRDIGLRVRIDCAKGMLSSGEAPIAQVALAVGYSDQAHFTRAFKLMSGLTPQAFRQQFRPGRLLAAE